MPAPTEPDTTGRAKKPARPLAPAQASAVLLLAAGRTDAEAAAELGVHRATVSQWKNHHPESIAELNRTRDSVHAELSGRLRVLASAALRAIGDALELDDPAARTAAAFELLKRVPLSIASRGPRHADEVVYAETARRLAATPIDDQFVNLLGRNAPPPMTTRSAAAADDLHALACGQQAEATAASLGHQNAACGRPVERVSVWLGDEAQASRCVRNAAPRPICLGVGGSLRR